MKSKNDFDDFIRARMENLETEGEPKGWDLMANRLEEEGNGTAAADEKVMEAVIFEKMSQMEAPFQPAHWAKLESQLNEEYRFVNKIIRYKSLELSILFLLIALFVNYYPQTSYNPNHKEIPLRTQAIAADIENKETTTSTSTDIKAENTGRENGKRASKTESLASPTATQHSNTTDKQTKKAVAVQAQATPATPNQAHARQAEQGITSTVIPPRTQLLDQLLNERLTGRAISSRQGSYLSQRLGKNSQAQINSSVGFDAASTEAFLASLDLIPDLDISPNYAADQQLIDQVKPAPKERVIRFGVQASSDYNRIITPPTYLAGESRSLDRYALGYSGGLTFSWGNKKWEVESGLIYSAKKYLPFNLSEIDYSLTEGLSGEGLKSFEYDMVAIPLNIRRQFITDGKWRFYATAGVSLNTVMQADYFFTSPAQPRPVGPPNSFAPPIPPNNNGTKAGVDKRAFTKGVFQGGSISQNSFFTANIGMGLERYISHRTSLYAQPQYQHSFLNLIEDGGIGPFQDKINTMRLIFGMRVKL